MHYFNSTNRSHIIIIMGVLLKMKWGIAMMILIPFLMEIQVLIGILIKNLQKYLCGSTHSTHISYIDTK